MKVAAAVPRVRVADCDFNASEIIRCVNEAVSMEVQVIVFPELCITGYSCGDLFFQETLLHGAVQSLRQIADATLLQDIIVIVGMPLAVESLLLNTAVVLQRGRMLGVVSKSYLPNYREFQEKRWFVSACCCDVKETILHQQLVPLGNDLVFCTPAGNFGIELCEDLWAPIPPSSCLAMNGADVIFNLSASDECSGKHDYLCSLLTDQSLRTCSGYVYSSSGFGESTADVVFGGNGIIYENGKLVSKTRRFSLDGQIAVADIDIASLRRERQANEVFVACARNHPFERVRRVVASPFLHRLE